METKRIRLSRAKGWRMPPNTVKVDRSTRWGNPFIVGQDGTAVECVYLYLWLLNGSICLSASEGCVARQKTAHKALAEERRRGYPNLLGRDLACWCRHDKPCHADVLLSLVSGKIFDVEAYYRKFGYTHDGQYLRPIKERA